MLSILKRFLALVFICTSLHSFAQLQITPQTNAQALAQKLVGGGVTISNVSITGSSLSTAFFVNQGGTQLNIDSGIVLTTGRAQTSGSSYGLNGTANSLASYSTNTGGDPDLTALVAPRTTNDAVVLEFDFVPIGDTVRFRYVFGSDEYPTFTCSNYNDVFAFFISGPGIFGTKNMALVPGTNIPVAINSINSGTPGGGYQLSTCSSMGPGSPFTQYYTNNAGNQYLTLNGHTKVLTAISQVQPCQVYHLKIAIADVTDHSYDSGVFIEAESLRSDPIHIVSSLPVINGLPYMVEGCQPGGIRIVRDRRSPTPQQVQFTFGGNAINGTDVQLISSTAEIPAGDSVLFVPIVPIVDNLPEGTEILKIYVSNGCALANNYYFDSIQIQVRDYDTLALLPRDTTLCKNSSVQLTAIGNFTNYQWTPSTGLSNATIGNPIATPLVSTTYVLTTGIGTCLAKDSARVLVKSLQLLSKKDINCHNGTTGQIKVSGGRAWQQGVQFSINNGAYGTDSTFSNLGVGNYVVKIKDGTGCIDSITVSLVQSYPDLLLADSVVTASCNNDNGKIYLSPSGGLPNYSFSTDGTNYSSNPVLTLDGGNYTLYVKDSNGCVTQKQELIGRDPAIQFVTHPSQSLCNGSPDGYLHIDANGGDGHYYYSIDGTNFQTVDSFYVNVTSLTITVKDIKGCSASSTVNIPLNQAVFVNAGPDTTICEGSSVQFNSTYNAVSFTWNANSSLSNASIANPVVSPATTTTYYVTATKDVCVAHDTITVNVWAAPIPNAGLDSAICYGKTITLNGSGGVEYSWLPVAQVSDPNIPDPSIRPLQTMNFYLKVYDIHGCPSLRYDTVRISVTPAVQAFAGRDTSVTVGQPLQMTGVDRGNSGVTVYQWIPSYGLNDANIANPIAILDRDMTYTLRLTTPEGCEGNDVVNVKVYKGPEIFVPSAFTPDDNGNNDLLRAIPIGMKKLHYFRVYNRWGQMIFSTVTEAKGWDGKINGVKQQTGTYVWIAEAEDYKGNTIFRKGITTLIR